MNITNNYKISLLYITIIITIITIINQFLLTINRLKKIWVELWYYLNLDWNQNNETKLDTYKQKKDVCL